MMERVDAVADGGVGGGGSLAGAQILVRVRVPILRVIFAVVIVALGVEMIYSGATGRL